MNLFGLCWYRCVCNINWVCWRSICPAHSHSTAAPIFSNILLLKREVYFDSSSLEIIPSLTFMHMPCKHPARGSCMPILPLACKLSESLWLILYKNLYFLVGFLWLGSKAALEGGLPWMSCTQPPALGSQGVKQDSTCQPLYPSWTVRSKCTVGPSMFSVLSELGPMVRRPLAKSEALHCASLLSLAKCASRLNTARYHVGSVLARRVSERISWQL